MQDEIINSETTSPFRKVHRFSGMGQYSRAASILRLLHSVRPFNVTRLITSIVVDPVDAVVATRAGSNIGIERFERIEPFLAHRDASAAVISIRDIASIRASIHSATPSRIFRASRHIVSAICIAVESLATTRGLAGAQDSIHRDQALAATCAQADISHANAAGRTSFDNGQIAINRSRFNGWPFPHPPIMSSAHEFVAG